MRSASSPPFLAAIPASAVALVTTPRGVLRPLRPPVSNGDAFAWTMAGLAAGASTLSARVAPHEHRFTRAATAAASPAAAALFRDTSPAQRLADLGHVDVASSAALDALVPLQCSGQLFVDVSTDVGYAPLLALARDCQVRSFDADVRSARLKQLSACFNGWDSPQAALRAPGASASAFVDASARSTPLVDELARLCALPPLPSSGVFLLRLGGEDVAATLATLDAVASAPIFASGDVRTIVIEVPWAPLLRDVTAPTGVLARLTATLERALALPALTGVQRDVLSLRIARAKTDDAALASARRTASKPSGRYAAPSAEEEAINAKVERHSALAALAREWAREQVARTTLVAIAPRDVAHHARNLAKRSAVEPADAPRTLVLVLGRAALPGDGDGGDAAGPAAGPAAAAAAAR